MQDTTVTFIFAGELRDITFNITSKSNDHYFLAMRSLNYNAYFIIQPIIRYNGGRTHIAHQPRDVDELTEWLEGLVLCYDYDVSSVAKRLLRKLIDTQSTISQGIACQRVARKLDYDNPDAHHPYDNNHQKIIVHKTRIGKKVPSHPLRYLHR